MPTLNTLATSLALVLLIPSLCQAQLVDIAAAAAAGGALEAGGAGAAQRQAGAIRGGMEAAMNRAEGRVEQRMPWIPGMPQPDQGGAQAGAAADPRPRTGGLILYDQLRDNDGGGEGEGLQEPVPDQYIVVKGDTLWSICARFFNNPWYWPKLWSYNEMITNPHWIYPGDLLNMRPPGSAPAEKPKAAAPASEKRAEAPRRPLRPATAPAPTGIYLRQAGFVEPGELDVSGKIIGSKEEKIMLATLDEVYVEVNPKHPLKAGERYSIYRVEHPVRRPYGNREVLGNVVEILGELEVRQITSGGIARAQIRQVLSPIERGLRVGPLRRTYKVVDPQPNQRNLEGVVVETLQPAMLVSNEQLLFVDLGKGDGLQVGNRLYVVRRGDGYERVLGNIPVDDRRYPREIVAEILIVDVRDRTSAGLITRPIKETRVGDRVEARKGY